ADAMVFTAEKTLKDNEGKIEEVLKKEIEEKTKALKDILKDGSKEDLEVKTKDLSESLQKVGAQMYQKSSEAGSGSAGQQTTGDGEPKAEDKKEEAKSDEPVEGEVVN
ncbi:MAG: Hsp70 family protein, partial [Patescibacteria group bacterium]